MKEGHMNPLVRLRETAPVFLVTFLLASFVILDGARAVITDPQDYFPNFNTGAGQQAFWNLREGTYNTGVGLFSLYTLLDGSYNTGVGAGALLFNIADRNTASGAAALLTNPTGPDNPAIGTSRSEEHTSELQSHSFISY